MIGSFIPAPDDVVDGFGTWMFAPDAVYWGMAIIPAATKGGIGHPSGERGWRGMMRNTRGCRRA